MLSYRYVSVKDCYKIGREYYINENWGLARDWMKEALRKYDEGK